MLKLFLEKWYIKFVAVPIFGFSIACYERVYGINFLSILVFLIFLFIISHNAKIKLDILKNPLTPMRIEMGMWIASFILLMNIKHPLGYGTLFVTIIHCHRIMMPFLYTKKDDPDFCEKF